MSRAESRCYGSVDPRSIADPIARTVSAGAATVRTRRSKYPSLVSMTTVRPAPSMFQNDLHGPSICMPIHRRPARRSAADVSGWSTDVGSCETVRTCSRGITKWLRISQPAGVPCASTSMVVGVILMSLTAAVGVSLTGCPGGALASANGGRWFTSLVKWVGEAASARRHVDMALVCRRVWCKSARGFAR